VVIRQVLIEGGGWKKGGAATCSEKNGKLKQIKKPGGGEVPRTKAQRFPFGGGGEKKTHLCGLKVLEELLPGLNLKLTRTSES